MLLNIIMGFGRVLHHEKTEKQIQIMAENTLSVGLMGVHKSNDQDKLFYRNFRCCACIFGNPKYNSYDPNVNWKSVDTHIHSKRHKLYLEQYMAFKKDQEEELQRIRIYKEIIKQKSG